MVYLKYIRTYNRVFFFKKRGDITGGDDSLKSFNDERLATMTRLFDMDYEDMVTGKIYTLEHRVQEIKN